MPQIRRLWKDIGKAHERKHPRAPSGRWLWREKSTEAILGFPRSTRVGRISTKRRMPEERGEGGHEEAGAGDEGDEGGSGLPSV